MTQYKWHYLEYRKVSIPMAGRKSTIVPSRMFWQPKRVFIETLIGEMKPVFSGDRGEWAWLSRKIIHQRIFWKFWTIRTLMQRTKWLVFHFNTPLQVFCFRVIDWRIRTRSEWGFQVWKLSEIRKSSTSWKLQDTDARITNRNFFHRKILHS